jgi:hypothetical protein
VRAFLAPLSIVSLTRQHLTCTTEDQHDARKSPTCSGAASQDQAPTSPETVTTRTEAHKSIPGGSSLTQTQTPYSARPDDAEPKQHSGGGLQAQTRAPGSNKHTQAPGRTTVAVTQIPTSKEIKKSGPQDPCTSSPGRQAQTSVAIENASAKLPTVAVGRVLSTKSDTSASAADSSTQLLLSDPTENVDLVAQKAQIPYTDAALRQEKSTSIDSTQTKDLEGGVQSFGLSRTRVQRLCAEAGSQKDDMDQARATGLHKSTSTAEGNMDVRSARPVIPHSTVNSNAEPEPTCQQSRQSYSQPPRPLTVSTTGSRPPNGEVRTSVDGTPDYFVHKRNTELQQYGEFLGVTRAIHESDRSGGSQHSISSEANEADNDSHTLGEQVKSARLIREKRQRITKDMKDLETRRRDTYVCMEASIAQMDADIREHLRLSSVLEKLQVLMAARERELTVVLHRADSHKDTLDRIKTEYQACEQAIKKMEAEFCSSGKELQGIVQGLGIFS